MSNKIRKVLLCGVAAITLVVSCFLGLQDNVHAIEPGADITGKITYNENRGGQGGYLAASNVKAGDTITATIDVTRPSEYNTPFNYYFTSGPLGTTPPVGQGGSGNAFTSNPNQDTEITKNGGTFTYVLSVTADRDYDNVYLQIRGGTYTGGGSTGETVLTYGATFSVTPGSTQASVEARYVDIATGSALHAPHTYNGNIGDTATTTAMSFTGYDLVAVDVDGTALAAPVATYDALLGTDQVVTYLYQATPLSTDGVATARFVDTDGNELSPAQSVKDVDGTAFSFVAPETINDYTLSSVLVNGTALAATTTMYSGTLDKDAEQVITFVYAKASPSTAPDPAAPTPNNDGGVPTGDQTQRSYLMYALIASLGVISVSGVKKVYLNKK